MQKIYENAVKDLNFKIDKINSTVNIITNKIHCASNESDQQKRFDILNEAADLEYKTFDNCNVTGALLELLEKEFEKEVTSTGGQG